MYKASQTLEKHKQNGCTIFITTVGDKSLPHPSVWPIQEKFSWKGECRFNVKMNYIEMKTNRFWLIFPIKNDIFLHIICRLYFKIRTLWTCSSLWNIQGIVLAHLDNFDLKIWYYVFQIIVKNFWLSLLEYYWSFIWKTALILLWI